MEPMLHGSPKKGRSIRTDTGAGYVSDPAGKIQIRLSRGEHGSVPVGFGRVRVRFSFGLVVEYVTRNRTELAQEPIGSGL